MAYEAQVQVNTKALEKHLTVINVALPGVLRSGLMASLIAYTSFTVTNKLLGQVLNRRTGNLIRSVLASPRIHVVSAPKVTGSFGTNVDYGRAHEEGFSGDVAIRAHERRAHTRQTKRGKQQVMAHTVRAHSRRMQIRARHYLRQSLLDHPGILTERIRRAIVLAVKSGRIPTVEEIK